MKHKPYRILYYIILRVIIFIFYPFPLHFGVKIGAFLGKIAYYIIPKERAKTLKHLRNAFQKEKSENEIRKIAKNVFSNLGKNAFEWLSFPKLNKRWFDTFITPQGLEHIIQAQKRGKGVIILASHVGNWELLAAYLNHKGYKGGIIVKRIYIEQIDRLFANMRKRMGNEIYYRDGSPKGPLRILKNGGFLGLLPDQDVDSVEGIFVDFFGKPAYTPTAPVKFAIKTGAALIPVFLIRGDNNKFKLIVEKEISLDITSDEERNTLVNTLKWSRILEKYIRQYPDQWVWMHRRWKTKQSNRKEVTQ